MNFNQLKSWVGLAGVPDGESKLAQKLGVIFEWATLVVAIWLPVQWYLETNNILTGVAASFFNWLVWATFFFEALSITITVRRKAYYLSTNWMNVVIIIFLFPSLWAQFPLLGSLRVLRVITALFVAAPWIGTGHRFLERNQIWTTMIVFLVVVLLGGLIITTFNSGITNPLEGIWWAFVTVTTVGYGTVVPTTPAGKVFAIIVMSMGFVIFSLLTAHISAYFIGRKTAKDQKKSRRVLIEKMNRTNEHIEDLHKKIDTLNKKIETLHDYKQ